MSLEAAVRGGDPALVLNELRGNSKVDQRSAEGLTPLMIAAGLGQPSLVEILLNAGADPLAVEPMMGATALHKAAQSGNRDVIGLLLDHGAFVDCQSPVLGNTPLIDAVLHKEADAVRLLLDRGARTGIRNHWHQSALDLAREDHLDAIAQMIEAKDVADAEQLASIPLITAIKVGDLEAVKRLLANGADIDARAPIVGNIDDDYTPLGIAVRERHSDIVTLLLDAGADPRGVIGLMRGTAVHEASFLGYADILRLFQAQPGQRGARALSLDAQGPYNGLTPLHDAVWHGHVEAAQLLVELGAPLGARTHAGFTPRELALRYSYEELARLLSEAEEFEKAGTDRDPA